MKRALLVAALAGTAACAGILGLRKAAPDRFPHRAHVLEGVACIDCHKGMSEAGDTGPLHLPDDATCVTCHVQPHDTRPCSGCHAGAYTAADLMQAREHLRFSHQRHMGEVKGNCVRCHSGVAGEERLRPTMATCLSCHQHRDQFAVRDCKGCHVDLPSEMTRPVSHLVHGPDFTREHGVRAASAADLCSTCHKESFCTGCHGATTAALPSRLGFDVPMGADLHRAGFMARHAEALRADPGMCSSCHTESSCRDCHDRRQVSAPLGEVANRSPHPPGWVGVATMNSHGPAARRDPAACASCHGGAGEALCIGCHRVGGVGGSIHPPGWSSRKNTSEVPCRACHVPGAL